MNTPNLTIQQLLEAGVHLGHKTFRWNPKMKNYIFGKKNSIHIIDLVQTLELTKEALSKVSSVIASGGKILFVSTKKQATESIANLAKDTSQYYVNYRWLGGMLTNWKTISNSIKKLKQINEALKKDDKKVIDAFYKKDSLVAGKLLSTNGESLEKHGMGGQTIAAWLDGKIAITAVSDVRSTDAILRYMKKSIPKFDFHAKSYKKFFEGIDIANSKMADVIKDFQDSDAPQFNGKSDKKRKEMAIAAKLAADRNESVKEDETDDPKSKKKDKINLKPKMDETMKNYKEFMKKVKEKRFQNEDTDKDTPGTQGDNAKWKKARSEVLKKYGVASCAFIKDDKTKKQCFKDLDDSHVADHEEQIKKEEKNVISKILGRRKEVQEAVTTGGIEYGEQDWDVQHRLENSYPNLHANYAEFHEQGLEGPYLWHGETYFFDRKVGSWYSVTAEDFVDDEISKDLSLAYVKDGMYKRQFAS